MSHQPEVDEFSALTNAATHATSRVFRRCTLPVALGVAGILMVGPIVPVVDAADDGARTALTARGHDRAVPPVVRPVADDPVAPLAEIPGYREYSGYLLVRQKSVERLQSEGMSARRAKRQHRKARQRIHDLDIRHALSSRRDTEDWRVIEVPAGVSDRVMCEMLAFTGDYEYVEPDWLVQPLATPPNDPYYDSQYHHAMMNSAAAWDTTTGSSDIVIAICDTGIDSDHPDLAANRVSGYNAVENLAEADGGTIEDIQGHGTATAGSAAALGNNGVGGTGMGWNFRHMTCRVSNSASGSAYTSDLVEAAMWAADHGARVINVSYSGVEAASVGTCGTYVKNAGALLTWSAGNDGVELSGDHANVIVVGATDQGDNITWFSNTGAMVDCVAPGYSILTCGLNGGYVNMSGTSFSAPIVAGVIAMMWAANPDLTPDEVETLLYDTCVDLGNVGEDSTYGRGRIDIGAAVVAAANAGGGGGGGGGGGEPTMALEVTPIPVVPGTELSATVTDAGPGQVTCLFLSWDGPSIEGHTIPRLHATIDLQAPWLAARPKRADELGLVMWTIKTRRRRATPELMWFQAASFGGAVTSVLEVPVSSP